MVSLDERDHAVLLSLLEHKVLTTHQIKSLYFRSFRRCQHRMKELSELDLVSSFSVGRRFGEGRPPACWFLTKAGLSEIAEAKDIRVSDLPWVPDHSYRSNLLLAHRLGVNAFFCALAEASRAHDGHCLHTWRPEHWVRTQAAEVKPDGVRAVRTSRRGVRVLPRVRPGHGGVRRALQEARGLPAARGWVDEGAGAHWVSEPPHHRSGGGARGGGRLGPSPRDREPARRQLARHLVPAVRGERGAADRARRVRASMEACRPMAIACRSVTSRPGPATSSGPLDASVATSPTPMPATVVGSPPSRPRPGSPPAPTCPLTPWRADAPRTERERLRRRERIGKASADTRDAQETTPARTTLARPGEDTPEPPGPGELRPLARALVDLAVAPEHEHEEDVP